MSDLQPSTSHLLSDSFLSSPVTVLIPGKKLQNSELSSCDLWSTVTKRARPVDWTDEIAYNKSCKLVGSLLSSQPNLVDNLCKWVTSDVTKRHLLTYKFRCRFSLHLGFLSFPSSHQLNYERTGWWVVVHIFKSSWSGTQDRSKKISNNLSELKKNVKLRVVSLRAMNRRASQQPAITLKTIEGGIRPARIPILMHLDHWGLDLGICRRDLAESWDRVLEL